MDFQVVKCLVRMKVKVRQIHFQSPNCLGMKKAVLFLKAYERCLPAALFSCSRFHVNRLRPFDELHAGLPCCPSRDDAGAAAAGAAAAASGSLPSTCYTHSLSNSILANQQTTTSDRTHTGSMPNLRVIHV